MYYLKLTTEGEMEYAYLETTTLILHRGNILRNLKGERTTPSQCGRMDQCCAYGPRPVIMEFDGDRVLSKELEFGPNASSLYLVIIDLNKAKDTKTILSDLNQCFAADKLTNSTDEMSNGVRKLFGEINLDITSRAMEAIKNGDLETVGVLMNEAQAQFRKLAIPASPEQLESEWLYKVLSTKSIQKHIYGGKGVGSQGDGSAQLLCRSKKDQDEVCRLIEAEYEGMSCIKLIVGGHQEIKKCIIPTANYNSSLFPASKTMSTALFPIIDHQDGLLKPAILILIEEVLNCGIDEVLLIVSSHDLASFEALFYEKLPLEQIEKLSPELQMYAQKIISYGNRIQLIVQREQLGLGHAVWTAKEHTISGEKVLLLLGDHLYKSMDLKSEKSCIQQLIDYYKRTGRDCYGLQLTPEEDLKHFGTVQGSWTTKDRDALLIEQIAEKPEVEYARKHLSVPNMPPNHYLTIFGLYILDGSIMELLANNICHEPPIRHNGTFQLTPCLQALCREQQTHGLLIKGKRFDIGGSPQGYVDTVYSFHKEEKSQVGSVLASPIIKKIRNNGNGGYVSNWKWPRNENGNGIADDDEDDDRGLLSIIDSLLIELE